jgi:hypothetical protein
MNPNKNKDHNPLKNKIRSRLDKARTLLNIAHVGSLISLAGAVAYLGSTKLPYSPSYIDDNTFGYTQEELLYKQKETDQSKMLNLVLSLATGLSVSTSAAQLTRLNLNSHKAKAEKNLQMTLAEPARIGDQYQTSERKAALQRSIQSNKFYKPEYLIDPQKAILDLDTIGRSSDSLKFDPDEYEALQELQTMLESYSLAFEHSSKLKLGVNTSKMLLAGMPDKNKSSTRENQAQELATDLDTITMKSGTYTIGFDRNQLSLLKNLSKEEINQLITPTSSEMLDPRRDINARDPNAVTSGDDALEQVLGRKIAIKDISRGQDLNSAHEQYLSSIIVQKELDRIGLSDIVEANKVFGYIQDDIGKNNKLFMSRVNGLNLDQYTLKKVSNEISHEQKVKILTGLRDKVKLILAEVSTLPPEGNDKSKPPYAYSPESTITIASKIAKNLDYILETPSELETNNSMTICPEAIRLILEYYSPLDIDYWVEMTKGFRYTNQPSHARATNNIMFDVDSGKLVLIDIGPNTGIRKKRA